MRKDKPNGTEIAEKAKGIRLQEDRALQAKKDGKNIKFVPSDLGRVKSLDEFENGQVMGVLDTEAEGDETGLPPGKYNIFLSNIDGKWQAFAESGGKIAAASARVDINHHKMEERKTTKTTFNQTGWCFCVCIVSFWFICIISVCICW